MAGRVPVLLVVALLAVPVAAQHVVVVPADSFGLLAPAVASAASGDVVLLGPGSYYELEDIVIEGKSLTIVGEGASEISGRIVVRSLAADQQVTLRGLSIVGIHTSIFPEPAADAAVAFTVCAGPLWIEDCSLQGANGMQGGFVCAPGGPALYVGRGEATVVSCALTGGPGPSTSPSSFGCHTALRGGLGAIVEHGSVAFHGCTIAGGVGGGDATDHELGAPGGIGLQAEGALLALSDTVVGGGAGGSGCLGAVAPSCAGGVAVVLMGGSTLFHQQSAFVGGVGGQLSPSGLAPDGDDLSATSGDDLVAWPDASRSLVVGSPVRENDPATIRYEGEQGDTVGLFFSLVPDHWLLWSKQGVFALGEPLQGPVVLTVSAPDGVFEVAFPAWPVSSFGIEAVDVFGQCFVKPAGGTALLGGPTCLTILSSAY